MGDPMRDDMQGSNIKRRGRARRAAMTEGLRRSASGSSSRTFYNLRML